ncbi:hypothetical protein ACFX13_034328 [Malus domestica]|nr:pectinesterase-like [Malus domestica]
MSPLTKMKLPCRFIFFTICLCALSMNTCASSIGSHYKNVPSPVLERSLDSTMELVQNVASAMSNIHMYVDPDADADAGEDDDRNLKIAISHCGYVLGSTYEAMNWSLSTIHQDYKQYKGKGDVISHARTRLNANLERQKTCVEAFDGTKYSMITQSFKQVRSSTQDLLKMLQAKPGRIEAKAGLEFWKTPNVTVSQDGSGNFRTITEALAVAPSHNQNYFVIFVKRGVYKENVNIDSSKCNLVLIGEGMDVTTISGSRSFRSGWETFYSATFAVSADGFIAMDIGFENTAGPENYQAVALLSGGDRAVFYRCKISGYQDTLLVHAGRQFFRECQISGSLDFIFGYGAAVFQKCLLTVKKTIPGVINTVTAHGRYAPKDPTGFSFQFCTISADSDVAAAYLGRPWGKYSRTVFMQSYISNVIQPQGWIEWKGKSALNTLYYGEYTNNGPGARLSSRVNWPGYHVIENPAEADEFTTAKFIEGDSWLTSTNVPFIRGLKD